MQRGRDGSFLTRTWRSVTGARGRREPAAGADLQRSRRRPADRPRPPRRRQARARRERDASPATPSSRSPIGPGAACNAAALHRDIRAAIVSPTAERTFVARAWKVKPKVTTAELGRKYPTLITVNRSGFRLTLFRNLKRVKTYPIAVGQVGLETPAGLYTIQDKQVEPVLARAEQRLGRRARRQGRSRRAPTNPIKARWMGIFDGAGIHGTSDIGSLGSAASHGCVRMAVPDVEDLYDRVAVGTPVYIA